MKKLNTFFAQYALYLLFIFSQSCEIEPVEKNLSNNRANSPIAKCIDGLADSYPCNGYDLMGHLPLSSFGATKCNDSWGWTDPSNGKEYALLGLDNGTAFIDISNSNDPLYLGKLPTNSISSLWRDIKVYNNHAFIVADIANDHGLQIFDLTRLRNVVDPPETFDADALFSLFDSAHNIVINEDKPYAYIVGTNRSSNYQGGTIIVDIENPTNPVYLNTIEGYSHDAQVITYTGPDTEHVGKEIFVGSNENKIVIVDITDKANPIQIASISYSNVGYTHQGWFSQDQKYFIVGDELDELNFGNNTKSIILDFSDLDNPIFHFNYLGPTLAIDHNGYTKGETFFVANYSAGLRMIDISNIEMMTMAEIGYFDTYPENDTAAFEGAWSVYPYFPSGNIIISDINRGLFVVRKSE